MPNEKLKQLFQAMYELTEPECRSSCRVPRSCCDPAYCAEAELYAQEVWGVDLKPLRTIHPRLPFMGESGCVVAPHLRPSCTLHTCDINGIGCKVHPQLDMEWTNHYYALRAEIEDIMNE